MPSGLADIARWGRAAALVATVALAGGARADEAVPGTDPATGFRMEKYRAPTPRSVPGAATIDVFGALDAKAEGVVFLDVMAHQGGAYDPATGAWRIQTPRENIPGSTWLPDVGLGAPGPRLLRYLEREVARLVGPPPGRPVVVYCQADCWMSWNVARRLVLMGYGQVRWFPEGTDGWRDAGLDLIPATVPPPVPPEAP